MSTFKILDCSDKFYVPDNHFKILLTKMTQNLERVYFKVTIEKQFEDNYHTPMLKILCFSHYVNK